MKKVRRRDMVTSRLGRKELIDGITDDLIKILVLFIEEDNLDSKKISGYLYKHPLDIEEIVKWSKEKGVYQRVYNEMYEYEGLFYLQMKANGKGKMEIPKNKKGDIKNEKI